MNPFISFVASNSGRIVAGLALVGWGWFGLSGTTGTIVAVTNKLDSESMNWMII